MPNRMTTISFTTRKAATDIWINGTVTAPNAHFEIVTSVQLPGQQPITFVPPGIECALAGVAPLRQQVALPTQMAARTASFARAYYQRRAGGYWDCYSYVHFVSGWRDRIVFDEDVTYREVPADYRQTQQGKPYAIYSGGNGPTHCFIGIGPRTSLGILGTGSPLVICPNSLLMQAYQGRYITEIRGIVS